MLHMDRVRYKNVPRPNCSDVGPQRSRTRTWTCTKTSNCDIMVHRQLSLSTYITITLTMYDVNSFTHLHKLILHMLKIFLSCMHQLLVYHVRCSLTKRLSIKQPKILHRRQHTLSKLLLLQSNSSLIILPIFTN